MHNTAVRVRIKIWVRIMSRVRVRVRVSYIMRICRWEKFSRCDKLFTTPVLSGPVSHYRVCPITESPAGDSVPVLQILPAILPVSHPMTKSP